MSEHPWPDDLTPPDPYTVQSGLDDFWAQLDHFGTLVARRQYLLAQEQVGELRRTVLGMMLALNGIARPVGTVHLNRYLSESQRAALEKTLRLPEVDAESLIGQAVALTVIYRWYAPQLVEKFGLTYPHTHEQSVWIELVNRLPDWPLHVSTE